MINKTRIGTRLLAGFGILVLLSLGYAVYSILQMAKLADITESLYRSPFEVRRAIRDLENDVLKMELLVDEAVSARSEGERSMLAGRIDSLEADSIAEIAVLFERFLGDRQAISGIQDSFAQWRSVRDRVLGLAIEGDFAGVASLKSGEYDRLLGVLDSSIQYVKVYSAARARAFYENALAIRDRTLALSIAIMLALAFAGILTALLIGLSIRRPMERLIAAVTDIAAGDLGSDLRIEGLDEMAKLGALLAGMQEDLRRKADLARRVAGGDLSSGLDPKGPADELGKALSGMLLSLREASASKALTAWVMEGINAASEETRGDLSAEEYARRALDFVAAYAGASVGVLLAARGGADEFELLAGWAYASRRGRSLGRGEGLAGQAAAGGELLIADDLPEDYIAVVSTLGEARARSVAALPLMSAESFGRAAVGVVELGFTSSPAPKVLDFLRAAAPGLSAGLASALARERVRRLLDESREQAMRLGRQEEELRQGNEELKCSEEELLAQQEELLTQREKLRAANEKLESAGADLLSKARELEAASEYKSAFLANMSHELRTPLNSILILSQLIAEDGPSSREKRLDYARSINAAGNDLLALITDILDLSKIEAGKIDVCLEPVDVRALALEIKAMFAAPAAKKAIGFRVEVAEGFPASIVSDRGRLSQILKNLVSNAIKFTERGEVVLELGSGGEGRAAAPSSCGAGQGLRISVRDSGIGVPADKAQAIFAAFRQAEVSTTRKYGGTGLGLTIARELARLLGGDIELRSEPGRGSVFTLALPSADPGTETAAKTKVEAAPAAGSGHSSEGATGEAGPPAKRVLIVEDDARQLEAMTELLSRPGIEIEGARSGMEALELIGRTHVDVVVMDLGFAGLSGIDLVRRVRAALPPRSTIVIYTGRELDGGAKRDLGALADRVISKGARSPARLMKALDALLGGEQGDYPGPADRGKGSEGQPRLAGRRVLLIDDDERNVFAIRCALEERGIEVVAGMNGREGLSELMRDPDIDLVLLDIMMPEMDGYGVMAEIRGNPATCCLPVIALTANALKGDSERCVAAGADDWLSKPVSVERLLSLLGQWMR